jgi:hypothetical protein
MDRRIDCEHEREHEHEIPNWRAKPIPVQAGIHQATYAGKVDGFPPARE